MGFTFALVGFFGGGAAPRTIEVEGFAFLAVAAGRVVAAVAGQVAVATHHALGGVAVALAAAAHREVGGRVDGGRRRRLGAAGRAVVVVADDVTAGDAADAVRVQSVEDDAHVGGRHPVLQHRTVLEVERRRTALHRAERDPRTCSPSIPSFLAIKSFELRFYENSQVIKWYLNVKNNALREHNRIWDFFNILSK